ETRRGERVRELVLALDLEAREGNVPGRGDLARVDEQQPALVLDRPAVDRQRLRPGTRQEQIELAPSAERREEERVLDANASRPEGGGADSGRAPYSSSAARRRRAVLAGLAGRFRAAPCAAFRA